MECLTLTDIVNAVHGKLVVEGSVKSFNKISTDTRKIEAQSVFIALKGDNFNGNDYIIEADEKGAALCIIDEIKFDIKAVKASMSIILVKDTKEALLDLAETYRKSLNVKVIGITGSTGKTSTKDMTYAVLSEKFKVYKTQGNFNNEIGLPLMIFNLDKTYDIAVLEMGMNHFGEIHKMAKAARPDIALITNIGMSHIENLKTRENILKAKLEITDYFNGGEMLIVNADNDLLSEISLLNKSYKIENIGTKENADIMAEKIMLNESDISFDILESGQKVYKDFKINVPGKHNVLNALLALAAGRLLGMSFSEMQRGMEKLNRTSMRLDIVKANGITIVDDCYNASPDSMRAAIDVLKNIKGNRKIAVLGTMRELGDEACKVHKDVAVYAKENSVTALIVLGEYSDAYKNGYADCGVFKSFQNTENAIEFLSSFLVKDDVILVKASRAMKFEEIVRQLKNLSY